MSVVLDQTAFTSGSSILYLVQGDTLPSLIVTVRNEIINQVTGVTTTEPVNISQSTVRLKIRQVGQTEIHDTVMGMPLPGLELPNGSIDYSTPYDIAGFGGRVIFTWNQNSLSFSGDAEAEIEITDSEGKIQTAYNLLRLKIRPQF